MRILPLVIQQEVLVANLVTNGGDEEFPHVVEPCHDLVVYLNALETLHELWHQTGAYICCNKVGIVPDHGVQCSHHGENDVVCHELSALVDIGHAVHHLINVLSNSRFKHQLITFVSLDHNIMLQHNGYTLQIVMNKVDKGCQLLVPAHTGNGLCKLLLGPSKFSKQVLESPVHLCLELGHLVGQVSVVLPPEFVQLRLQLVDELEHPLPLVLQAEGDVRKVFDLFELVEEFHGKLVLVLLQVVPQSLDLVVLYTVLVN